MEDKVIKKEKVKKLERKSSKPMDRETKYTEPAGTTAFPSNDKATGVLRNTEKMLHELRLNPPSELDSHGKRLVADLENLTSTQRRFLEEKNPDSLIQQIMEDGRLALQELNHDIKMGKLKGVDKQTAREMTDQASTVIENLQALALELITSGSFRGDFLEFLNCLVYIAQDLTGLPLTNVTDELKPGNILHGGQDVKGFTEDVKDKVTNVTNALKQNVRTVGKEETRPLTDEQVNELTDKLLRVLKSLGTRTRSRNAIKGLFGVTTMFTRHYAIQRNAKSMKDSVESNVHLTNLAKHSRMLMERFAGKEIMDGLIGHVKSISKISYNDKDVSTFFHDAREFFINSMDHPETIDTRETRKELKRLIRRARVLSEKRDLSEHFLGILNYSSKAVKGVSNDPHLAQLQYDITHFMNDLVRDNQGNIVLSRHSLNQLKVILVSSLLERMTVPLPTVRSEDEKMEFEVSNLFLTIKDVIPDMIHFEFMEKLDVDTRNLLNVKVAEDNQLMFHANNIKYRIKDANLWFKRKKFPKAEDSGLLTIDMPGDGLALKIILSVTLGGPTLLKVKSVDCDIDRLAISLSGTKHDKLYNAFLKIAKGPIKKRVQTSIEDKIVETISMVNTEVSRQVQTGPKKIAGMIERKTNLPLTSKTAGSHETIKHKKNKAKAAKMSPDTLKKNKATAAKMSPETLKKKETTTTDKIKVKGDKTKVKDKTIVKGDKTKVKGEQIKVKGEKTSPGRAEKIKVTGEKTSPGAKYLKDKEKVTSKS